MELGKSAAHRIRRRKLVPGVCYGKGVQPFHLAVEPDALARILSTPKGRNMVFHLAVEDKSHPVMVQSVQRDPVKRAMLHVDFLVVSSDDWVMVDVPLKVTGKSEGEKAGGRLELVRRSVDLRCQVKDIPECIEYDVTDLQIGQNVPASKLVLPEGSEIASKSDFVVLQVVVPKGKAAEAAVPGAPVKAED
ncbi:MAG: 50S ribosomal protein L25 [Bradymonadales bacterium]|nr:50S ribosomal protein L25 [Bradymonadales bacterium]